MTKNIKNIITSPAMKNSLNFDYSHFTEKISYKELEAQQVPKVWEFISAQGAAKFTHLCRVGRKNLQFY